MNVTLILCTPVLYIFTIRSKIAYDHSKRPKKGTTFPQINMIVVTCNFSFSVVVVIFVFRRVDNRVQGSE